MAKDSRFTGKPYDADMGAYVFPFRNYRSDEARWMSADPSGFPDGVNSQSYLANPNAEVDALGLIVVGSKFGPSTTFDQTVDVMENNILKTIKVSITVDTYHATTKDRSISLDVTKFVAQSISTPGYDFSFNCHGFVFSAKGYWVDNSYINDDFMKAEGYRRTSSITNAKVATFGENEHSGFVKGSTIDSKYGNRAEIKNDSPSFLGLKYGTVKYWE